VKRFSLAFMLCLASFQGKCQGQPALAVTAEFTGRGTYHCAYGQDGSHVRLAVRNNTASTRSFFVWTCSWKECWTINKTVVHFPLQSCDKNIPEEIRLLPGQEVVFYTFAVLNLKQDDADLVDITKQFQDKKSEIRFAFTEVSKQEDLENISAVMNQEVGNTYWSAPVAIDLPDNTYRIRSVPTK
jgi:hypothetical protein